MRGSGTVTLGRERVAVDGLKAEIDHKALEGRVAYRFGTAAAPARLDAALSGAELDFDRDFNGISKGNRIFRGAYAGEGTNPGWRLQAQIKPDN